MKLCFKSIVIGIVVYVIGCSSPLLSPVVTAQDRFAECDVCGYCQGMAGTPPGAWEGCVKCVYPGLPAGVKPTENATLKVDNNKTSVTYNRPVTPQPGRYYTMLGCLDSQFGSFEDREAAGSFVNFLLQRVIFTFAGAIAFVYLIYGSIVIMMAKGDPVKLSQGRGIVVGSIVGIIFLLTMNLVVSLIGNGILRIPGFGG